MTTAKECPVLIVEDDNEIRSMLAEVLKMEGYPVQTAENGRDAMKLLGSCDAPCLILLDLMMPIMNGWEFLEAVKAQNHRLAAIPIVVVSAVGDKAQSLATKGVLKKPVDLDTLLSVVSQYCQRPQEEQKGA